MIKRISIFYCLSIFILFLSCKKQTVEPKFDYNQKANELIQQILIDESCDCVLEIPNESMIKISENENPAFDIRKKVTESLRLRDRKELDSLEKLSNHFILDTNYLKKQNIEMFKSVSIRKKLDKDPTSCPKGILWIVKPIFDKEYKHTAVNYGFAFRCLGTTMSVYKFENGKWKR